MARDGATVVAYSCVGLVLGALAALGFSRGDVAIGSIALVFALGSVALVLRTVWDRQDAKGPTREHAATRRSRALP